MENFIVRIYRRKSDDPDCITGVVENPDLGESRHFSTIDDLMSIIIPHKNDTKNSRRKQVMEQRKYRRFAIKDGTLIFNSSTDVGEIVDLSMGGIAFTCPDMPEESGNSFDIGIICGEDEYYTGKIQCRKVMCQGTSSDSMFSNPEKSKRYSLEFDELAPKQRLHLEHIIQKYGMCEV